MKILIAVMTCHKFEARAEIIRQTWGQDVVGADLRFFLGFESLAAGIMNGLQDRVYLDAPDDYVNLRRKVQKMFAWAVEQGYDYIFKTDDDVYIIPERLLGSAFAASPYSGRYRGPSGTYPPPIPGLPTGMDLYGYSESGFCSGFGYWLNNRCASLVANAPDNHDWAEDRFAGNVLNRNGIRGTMDGTIRLWPFNPCPSNSHLCVAGVCPRCLDGMRRVSVLCPHERPEMLQIFHRAFKETGVLPTR